MAYSRDDVVEVRIGGGETPWEEIPASFTFVGLDSPDDITALCDNIARTMNRQVRWNWSWSYNGHYSIPR